MSRPLLRSLAELRIAKPNPRPFRSLQTQARQFNPTAQIIDPLPPSAESTPSQSTTTKTPQKKLPNPPRQRLPTAPSNPPATGPLDASVHQLLPLLAAQPARYITVHIHGRPYLVTEGDSVRLPFRMPGVEPGDILRLNRASVLGSRDFTVKGEPWVDERLFVCRAVVTGTEKEPVRVMIKKKRRCRRKKHVFSQHHYTVLRISEVKVQEVEE